MKDWSQNGEQQAVLDAFYDEERKLPYKDKGGRFLDLGAYHACENSNTRALYEFGWSGVMVEPGPGQIQGLIREYGNEPRIVLVQAAVGLAPRLAQMYVTDDALSTIDDDFHERATLKGYKYYGSVQVPCLSLERLFMEFGNAYDFVSIDVEGGSADLALQFLGMIAEHPENYREAAAPRCICVEHDHRADELGTAGAAKGYRVALKNGENVVLVRG